MGSHRCDFIVTALCDICDDHHSDMYLFVSLVLVAFTASTVSGQCQVEYCSTNIQQEFVDAPCNNRGRYELQRGANIGITVDFTTGQGVTDGNLITHVTGTLPFPPIPIPFAGGHNQAVCGNVADHQQGINACNGLTPFTGYRYSDVISVPSISPTVPVKVDYKLTSRQGDVVCMVIYVQVT